MVEVLDKESLKALSADTRQDIIKLLSQRPYTASELSKKLGKHVTTITEHLDMLEKTGITERKEDGHKWVYYILTNKGQKLLKPQLYSWIIVLSLAVVSFFFGIWQITFSSFGAAGSADNFQKTAPLLTETASTCTTQPVLTNEIIMGIVLIALALFGFGYVLGKYSKSTK